MQHSGDVVQLFTNFDYIGLEKWFAHLRKTWTLKQNFYALLLPLSRQTVEKTTVKKK